MLFRSVSQSRYSTFIHTYNTNSAELNVNVNQTQLKQISPLNSNNFKFLPTNSYQTQVGNAQMTVDLQATHYYTLINQTNTEPHLIKEPPFTNQQKTLLHIQNLTDNTLNLKTTNGKTTMIADVKPNDHDDHKINPMKINLALFENERKITNQQKTLLHITNLS